MSQKVTVRCLLWSRPSQCHDNDRTFSPSVHISCLRVSICHVVTEPLRDEPVCPLPNAIAGEKQCVKGVRSNAQVYDYIIPSRRCSPPSLAHALSTPFFVEWGTHTACHCTAGHCPAAWRAFVCHTERCGAFDNVSLIAVCVLFFVCATWQPKPLVFLYTPVWSVVHVLHMSLVCVAPELKSYPEVRPTRHRTPFNWVKLTRQIGRERTNRE